MRPARPLRSETQRLTTRMYSGLVPLYYAPCGSGLVPGITRTLDAALRRRARYCCAQNAAQVSCVARVYLAGEGKTGTGGDQLLGGSGRRPYRTQPSPKSPMVESAAYVLALRLVLATPE